MVVSISELFFPLSFGSLHVRVGVRLLGVFRERFSEGGGLFDDSFLFGIFLLFLFEEFLLLVGCM